MRIAHRTTRIRLRAASLPTDQLRDEILESRGRHPMVGFINTRVSIQPWVTHNPVDEVIDDRGDVVYAAEPIVE
jgi:hypothetical protein